MFMVFLLSAQCAVGSAAGDLSLLTDGGETDSLDRPLVLFTTLNDGSVLTVDNQGNVSVNSFSNGVLSTQWTVFLDVTPTTLGWTTLRSWFRWPTMMEPMSFR